VSAHFTVRFVFFLKWVYPLGLVSTGSTGFVLQWRFSFIHSFFYLFFFFYVFSLVQLLHGAFQEATPFLPAWRGMLESVAGNFGLEEPQLLFLGSVLGLAAPRAATGQHMLTCARHFRKVCAPSFLRPPSLLHTGIWPPQSHFYVQVVLSPSGMWNKDRTKYLCCGHLVLERFPAFFWFRGSRLAWQARPRGASRLSRTCVRHQYAPRGREGRGCRGPGRAGRGCGGAGRAGPGTPLCSAG